MKKRVFKFVAIAVLLFLTTIPVLAQNFKFAVMSDSRGKYDGVNEPVLSALVEHLITNHPEIKFLIFPGDMVDGNRTDPDRTVSELLNWKRVMEPVYNHPGMIDPKIWVTVGNHEVQHYKDEENFRKVFPDMPKNGPDDELGLTYYFEHDNVRFVVINSDRWYYGDPEDTTDDKRDWHYIKHLDWVEKVLKDGEEKENKHIFVVSHEMPFPVGGHLRDGLPYLGMNLTLPLDSTRQWYLNQRNMFWKLLVDYNVPAYFCGHEHLYSRQSVDGVFQIITGSAGAPVYYFNSKYGDNPQEKKRGQELTYDEALPYYKVLNYNYGPGGNAQASDDFVGIRAFHYSVVEVDGDKISVQTFGVPPKEGTLSEMEGDIKLIDSFNVR
jgi:hypothetical protein